MYMEKYAEMRRLDLIDLRNDLIKGFAQIERETGISASYLSRCAYPEGKKGKRYIKDNNVDLLDSHYPWWRKRELRHLTGRITRSGKTELLIKIMGNGINEEGTNYNANLSEIIAQRVPLISKAQAGDWCQGTAQDIAPEDWLISPLKVSSDAFALSVSGISMEPEYRDGDIIFVDPGREAKHNDDVIICLMPSGEANFKRLQIEESGSYLIAINKSFPAPIVPLDQEARICGVVVFSGRYRSP